MAQIIQTPELLIEEEVLSPPRLTALFPDPELRELLLANGVLAPDKNGFVRVRFVGVAVANGRSFQVLPKMFSPSSTNIKVAMRQVVRALRRHAGWRPSNEHQVPFLDPRATTTGLNALAVADWLIRDYLNAGIYRRLREKEEINGQGRVNWRRTIERMGPIFSSGRPLYTDMITNATAKDGDHFISRLHRQIVAVAADEYGHLLGYAPLALDHEPFEPFPYMPPENLCRRHINQEMREVFSDRSLQLLPMLLAWLTASQRAKQAGLSLYGTSTFYNVWENACALLLGNEREQWKTHIPRPRWLSKDGSEQHAKTFEPDIVTRMQDGEDEHLLIADAKYYQLQMPPFLNGQPGVNDIAKQLWYERCLTAPALALGITRIHNVFVVPGPEREDSFWSDGQVELSGLDQSLVKIKRLSGLHALARYADGAPLDAAQIRSVVLEG